MSSHLLMLDGPPSVTRRAGAVHAQGLDVWLGTDAGSTQYDMAAEADFRSVGIITDWSAPCWAVDLTYDTAESAQDELPSGIRPILQEGSRRLMFDVHAYEILVRVASLRLSEQYLLEGQVLFEGLPLSGAAVRLDAERTDTTVLTDRSGGFRLPPLAHGAYRLQIAVEGAVLAVPPIALH
jgi:hypothetical protein